MQLTEKIGRLAAEWGWNLETFSRRTGLHRNTLRPVLAGVPKKLHNHTVHRCADALGFTVQELTDWPLEKLLGRVRRMHQGDVRAIETQLQETGQPELRNWLARNPRRAGTLTPAERDELLSLQGTGGPLSYEGVEHFVGQLERKRELQRRIEIIAGTEYLPFLEQMVNLLFEKVQPFREPP